MAAAIRSPSLARLRKNRRSAISRALAASVISAACSLPRSAWAIAWPASARVDLRRRRRFHITHPCLQPVQHAGGLLGGRERVVGALALHGEGAAQLLDLGPACFPRLVPLVGLGFDAVGVGLGGDDADEDEDDDDRGAGAGGLQDGPDEGGVHAPAFREDPCE